MFTPTPSNAKIINWFRSIIDIISPNNFVNAVYSTLHGITASHVNICINDDVSCLSCNFPDEYFFFLLVGFIAAFFSTTKNNRWLRKKQQQQQKQQVVFFCVVDCLVFGQNKSVNDMPMMKLTAIRKLLEMTCEKDCANTITYMRQNHKNEFGI